MSLNREGVIAALSGNTPPPSPPMETTPVAPPVVDTPKPIGDAPAAPPIELDADRFARFAKQEAKIQADRTALKAEQDAAEKEKEKIKAIQTQYNEYEALKAKDPIAALKYLGFSEGDIINFLSDSELTVEQKAAKAADDKIKEFEVRQKAEKEAETKARAEAQAKVEADAVAQYKADVAKVIAVDKDKYEYSAFHGQAAEELIWETVIETYKLDCETDPKAKPLTATEAADMVEKFYEENDKLMATLKKRSGVSTPKTPENEELTSTGFKGDRPQVNAPPEPTKVQASRASRVPSQVEGRSQANAVAPVEVKQLHAPKSLARAHATTTAAAANNTIPLNESQSEKRERIIAKIKAGAY